MTKHKGIFRWIPAVSLVLFVLALLCGGIHLAACRSVAFADWFNGAPAAFFRAVLAHLTGWLPFSFAELLILLLLPAAVCFLIFAIRRSISTRSGTCRCVTGLLSVAAGLYALFVLTFAVGYQSSPLEDKLELQTGDVTEDSLYDTTVRVIGELNALCAEVDFLTSSSSVMPFSFTEMTASLNEAYASLSADYSFVPSLRSSPKLITLSHAMTYTHISGVYTFFTGEANVNVYYPDFVVPYTTAHEMAHQRGIARENEANFAAFLVCIRSAEPYIRYSGYVNLYEYLTSALYSTSPDRYREALALLDRRVLTEFSAYNDFFKPFQHSVASEVADKVNDAYLSSQGTPGTVSYSLVVELAVAYYRTDSYTANGVLSATGSPSGN